MVRLRTDSRHGGLRGAQDRDRTAEECHQGKTMRRLVRDQFCNNNVSYRRQDSCTNSFFLFIVFITFIRPDNTLIRQHSISCGPTSGLACCVRDLKFSPDPADSVNQILSRVRADQIRTSRIMITV